jgi:hypothetical protein
VSAPLVSCLMVTPRPGRARAARDRLPESLSRIRRWSWWSSTTATPTTGRCSTSFAIAWRSATTASRRRRGRHLGALRNLALDAASGELCAQWDDDEWYHPERLRVQVAALERASAVASVLRWTLMHVDTPRWRALPYRADAGDGTPGTIVHRRTEVRYPNLRRSEDARFLSELAATGPIAILGREHSHLFIRCFHGGNTWDEAHFRKRLRRTPRAALHYAWGLVRGDLRGHPQLQLSADERAAIAALHAATP